MKKIIALLLLLSSFTGANAQGLSSDGNDFYVGWLYPSYNAQGIGKDTAVAKFFGVYILVSSYTDKNSVDISYFDASGKESVVKTYPLQKRRTVQIPIDESKMRMTEPGEIPEWKSMHITSKAPVKVEFFSTGANSGGSYLAIPTTTLGKNYVVESYHDNTGGAGGWLSAENSAGYFMIIAAYDGTSVVITPNSSTIKGYPGVNCGLRANGKPQPYIIALNRGQCYMVKSEPNNGCNISGSTVESDKPVAVIAGHENAMTDGSDAGTIAAEQRDFMVEQMLPVEYWDSIGYVSIPKVDSKSAPGGDGDEYQFFYGKPLNALPTYPKGAHVILNPGANTYDLWQYPSSPSFKTSVTSSISAYDSGGVRFHVVQYDQRMVGSQIFPAPSQLSIIPMSRWKTSYLWYVPNNTQTIFQGYYINLIVNATDYNDGTLLISIDNGALKPMKSSFSVQKKYTFPDHPHLIGVQMKQSYGSYYATSSTQTPFIIYNYGFRAVDPNRSLGNFDSLEHYFSYASPTGFVSNLLDSSVISLSVDTLCAKWLICAKTIGKNTPKLSQIALLNDPFNDLGHGIKVSRNVNISIKDDLDNNNEIALPAIDSLHCFSLEVSNPLDSAYAAILVTDDHGNSTVTELRYKAFGFADTIMSADFDPVHIRYLRSPDSNRYRKDSIFYPITAIGDSHCATVYYFVPGDSAKGAKPIIITSAKLNGIDGWFTMTSSLPLPIFLSRRSSSRSADTLKITICFNSKDTAVHTDTMMLSTDCFDAPVFLYGRGGTGLITVTDHDIGPVRIGTTWCERFAKVVTIKNIGNLPFTLSDKWVIDASGPEFSMSPASAQRLPVTLWPPNDPDHLRGDTINLYFCYTPANEGEDSTIVTWNTDIKAPYDKQVKSWSYLKGTGIKAGIYFDRKEDVIVADSNLTPQQIVSRINMMSRANTKIHVDKLFFRGLSANEFRIVGNQLGMLPFENFDVDPGDTIWVDIAFTPDYTKPNSADRFADLVAVYFTDQTLTTTDTTAMKVTGTFNKSLSVHQSKSRVLKAYLYGNQLAVELPRTAQPPFDCSLYDLLGRKVKDWGREEIVLHSNSIALPLPAITAGAYILRFNVAGEQNGCMILIK